MAGKWEQQLDGFKAKLAIDKHNLDEELIQHPQIFSDVADATAQLVSLRDQHKDDLKEVESRLTIKAKAKLEADSGGKVTVSQIDAVVQGSKELLDAKQDFRWYCMLVDRADALKSSFMQRGSMLKVLCELYVAGYFARRTVDASPKASNAEYDKARAEIAASRQRRRLRTDDQE